MEVRVYPCRRKPFLRQALQTLKGSSIPQTLSNIREFQPRHEARYNLAKLVSSYVTYGKHNWERNRRSSLVSSHLLARSPRRFVAKPCALTRLPLSRRLYVREGSRRNSWVVVVDGVSKSWSVFQRMCTDEERQEVAAARAAVQHCGAAGCCAAVPTPGGGSWDPVCQASKRVRVGGEAEGASCRPLPCVSQPSFLPAPPLHFQR